MDVEMKTMIHYFLRYHASDLHFSISNNFVNVTIRTDDAMRSLSSKAFHLKFYQYLKYISGFDLSDFIEPQSASFSYDYDDITYYFRFSVIHSLNFETGVLRMLYNKAKIRLTDLSVQNDEIAILKQWMSKRGGLIILSGPTGSGKTTTLHAMLQYIYELQHPKIITIEDPIEIRNKNFVQMQVQKERGLSWDATLSHVLRHDPDIIMVGEVRNEEQAALMIRSALTGHLVLTTIHAKSTVEVISRLKDLGVDETLLIDSIVGITTQRLYKISTSKKTSFYDTMDNDELRNYLKDEKRGEYHKNFTKKLYKAVDDGLIDFEEAKKDL